MNFLLHILGVDDLSGRWYGFWSGFGSDLGEISIVGALWRKHNCHQTGCWRLGRHKHGDWMLCSKHHPVGAPTAETVAASTKDGE